MHLTPPPDETHTVVLVEDHEIVREGLRALLEAEAGLRVVGEAGTGPEGVQLVQELCPSLLIVDLMLPGLNGLEVTWQVKRACPETHVVMLSMYDSEPYVLEAIRSGASAYVLKNSGASELRKAVYEVLNGRRYLGPPLSERAIEAYVREAQDELAPFELYGSLTRREREVFQLTVEGRTSREIADALHISPRTVDKHRANLMNKLDRHSQTELIQYAIACGLLPSPPALFGG